MIGAPARLAARVIGLPGQVVGAVTAATSGRQHRRSWMGDNRAHIEVRGVHLAGQEQLARGVEDALRRLKGVQWAQVNAVTARVVVAFDEDGPELDDLIDVVEGVEDAHDVADQRFPHTWPEHPADSEPIRRNAIALGADIAGLGASVFGQLLRLTPLPSEVATVVALVDNEPRARRFLEHHLGPQVTDLGLGFGNVVAQALGHGPLGLVVDMANRAGAVGELVARRRAWERLEPTLAGGYHEVPLSPLDIAPRPVPRPPGPVTRFADVASIGSTAVFAAVLATTASPRRAASAFTAGTPKAARLGREAFGASLGRELAGRDVLVLDSRVLRRLDSVDTVVLDSAILRTGNAELAGFVDVGGGDPDAAIRAATLFDPSSPLRLRRRGRWAMGPLDALGAAAPRGAATAARALRHQHRYVLGVARSGQLVALAGIDDQADPLAPVLATQARSGGLTVIIAGTHRQLARSLQAERTVPGGRQLASSVRALQSEGRSVLLVSGGSHHGALVAADCSVGVRPVAAPLVAPTRGRPAPTIPNGDHAPWGADIITGPGLGGAALVLQAVPVARQVSRRSVALSLTGSATGLVWAMVGPAATAGRRAGLPVNAAALVAEAGGALAGTVAGRRPLPSPRPTPAWHAMSGQSVLATLGVSPSGLDHDEVQRRRPAPTASPSVAATALRAVTDELRNPLTPILAAGAGLAALTGSATDAALVAGVTGANVVIGAAQRLRTDRQLDRLFRASTVAVAVRRSGRRTVVEPAQVVRGDIVELAAGDVVPADCRILEAEGCEADESILTGEPTPVAKEAAATPGAGLAERSGMLYEGTTVVNGTALAVAVATGTGTEVGRVLADALPPPTSGVQSRLRSITTTILPATVASGAAVTGISLLHGRPLPQAVASGVSLMVAAVPEGLPLLATMAEMAAAQRLSGRSALVRNPSTLEALGRVDLLCFDKTGTLTAGRISLARVSDGITDEPIDRLGPAHAGILAAAVRASPVPDADVLPRATDQAVIDGAARAGVTPADGMGAWSPVAELAFESTRGFHASVGVGLDGPRVSVKGAPEVVLPRCATWCAAGNAVALTRRVRHRLDAEVERMARQGLRVLAVAERPSSARPELPDDRVSGLELLGFLGMADTVRPTAAAAIDRLRQGGVEVAMITGDHPSTAGAIAAELGIRNGKRLIVGSDIDRCTDDELEALVGQVSVFARVTPAHKARIVRAQQRSGRIVAMTGDGANDAPAIRLAHTGIALGDRCAPAARQAADLIVTDNRIETIIDAIVEGRAMWVSVRDALAILLGGNLGEIAFTVGATAVSGRSPLGTRQLLLVNLLTDLLPALTVAMRPPHLVTPEALLHEGPDSSLGTTLTRQIALRAVATAAGAGGAWMVARPTGTARRAGTVALVALVGTQLGQTAIAGRASPLVLASAALSQAALVAIVQTPGVSQFFGCTPLGPVGWTVATTSAAAATTGSVVVPWTAGRWRARRHPR